MDAHEAIPLVPRGDDASDLPSTSLTLLAPHRRRAGLVRSACVIGVGLVLAAVATTATGRGGKRSLPSGAGPSALAATGGFSTSTTSPATTSPAAASSPAFPHLLFIHADDLGWNDIGYQSTDLGACTPFLDGLAADGIKLTNYYAQQSCTPSRAALMTGKLPITIGMQHGVIMADQVMGVPHTHTHTLTSPPARPSPPPPPRLPAVGPPPRRGSSAPIPQRCRGLRHPHHRQVAPRPLHRQPLASGARF